MSRFQNNPYCGTLNQVTEHLSMSNSAKWEFYFVLAHFRPGWDEIFDPIVVHGAVNFQLQFSGNAFLLADWTIYQQIS